MFKPNLLIKKAFTLIEVMASLLIFTIGGTMALTVFNFNAANRIDLDAKTEANVLANNILKTLILQYKNNTASVLITGDSWTNSSGIPVYANHTAWNWVVIPAYPSTWTTTFPTTQATSFASANSFFTEYGDSETPKRSIFEYGYCIVNNNLENNLNYNRNTENAKTITSPDLINNTNIHDRMDNIQILRVVVTWPRFKIINGVSTAIDRDKRQRVSVVTLLQR